MYNKKMYQFNVTKINGKLAGFCERVIKNEMGTSKLNYSMAFLVMRQRSFPFSDYINLSQLDEGDSVKLTLDTLHPKDIINIPN